MKLGFKADNLLERLAKWFNLTPMPTAYVFFGMMSSRTLMAGVRLGFFAALADGPATAEALAEKLKMPVEGTRMLLEGLVACDAVNRKRGVYSLAPREKRWLDPRSPQYIGGFIDFNYTQWEWWSQLEEVVRSGKSLEIHDFAPDDPRWRLYIHGMHQLARLAAPEVASAIPLPKGAKHILDLGGAHGWFAAELCQRNKGVKATVLDLEGSARIGREIIASAGLSHLVTHREGNILTADLEGPYDAALLFQVMHHLSPAQNVALLRRIRAALTPKGTLAVLEYMREEVEAEPSTSALIGLHYFITSKAAAYTPAEMEGFLGDAGFRIIKSQPIRRLPLQTLITAQPE